MSIQSLTDSGQPLTDVSAAVCVIGGGMAGLIAARRIARTGRTVIVLESGGPGIDPAALELNKIEDVYNSYHGAFNGRFRGLGGSSLQWGGRLLPLSPSDAEDRPYLSQKKWPLDPKQLQQYKGEIEQLFKVGDSSYEEGFLDEFDTRGALPKSDPNITIRSPKWVAFSRCNLGLLLRDELERIPALDIWLCATVCEFDVDTLGGRLKSVTARDAGGRRLRVTASEFIVAAGTIEATRLLLLIDASTDGRAFAGCRVLGRYFQDHVGARVADFQPVDWRVTNQSIGYRFIQSTRRSLHFEMTPAAQARAGVASGFAHATMVPTQNSSTDILKRFLRGLQRGKVALGSRDLLRLLGSSPDVLRGVYWRYGRKTHYWPKDLPHQMNIWIEQLPHWDNRISLSTDRDSFGVPKARIEWRQTDAEERTFRACIAQLKSYWERHQLDRWCRLAWTKEAQDSSLPVIGVATDLLHPSSSTRMGTDPADSVVNPNLQTHALPNVTVASASVFPTAGSANPTLTILQIALYAADAVMSRLS